MPHKRSSGWRLTRGPRHGQGCSTGGNVLSRELGGLELLIQAPHVLPRRAFPFQEDAAMSAKNPEPSATAKGQAEKEPEKHLEARGENPDCG